MKIVNTKKIDSLELHDIELWLELHGFARKDKSGIGFYQDFYKAHPDDIAAAKAEQEADRKKREEKARKAMLHEMGDL